MSTSWDLLQFIEEISPNFMEIEGRIFFVRFSENEEELREKISRYSDRVLAQRYINTVTISDQIDALNVSWANDIESMDRILQKIMIIISNSIELKVGYSVIKYLYHSIDLEENEVTFNLVQNSAEQVQELVIRTEI